MANEDKVAFDKLPLKERIVTTASSGLIKFFRGMEMAGLLNKEQVAKQIGRVKKLSAIARGEEPTEEVKPA